MSTATSQLDVRDLGRMPYEKAWTLQRQVHTLVLTRQIPPPGALLLMEHDPVITISARRGAGEHILADGEQLKTLGVDVCETNRGGDVTYHGPGQLTAYPILRLADLHLNVGRYMRLLENVVIDVAAAFGVSAHRQPGQTGVWTKIENQTPPIEVKLAAMGVRVRKNVTMHGLALNVSTDLSHFETIAPCGLKNCKVTSLLQLLGDQCPAMSQVKQQLITSLSQRIDRILKAR